MDVYFLAKQMGASAKMIEDHDGHVNTVEHADLVLQGMGGWDPIAIADKEEATETGGKAAPPVVEGRARAQAKTATPPMKPGRRPKA